MPTLPARNADPAAPPSSRFATLNLRAVYSQTTHWITRRTPSPQSGSGDSPTAVIAIPTIYQGLNSGPAPGTVVGIVLGSVAAFLLLIWILWALSNGNGFIRTSQLEEEEIVVRRRSRSPRSRRSQPRTEMTSRSPRRERIIRQERVVRDIPLPRDSSRIRETIIIDEPRDERRVEGDDVVEVIEEHSSMSIPPPRRKSRRSSGYR